MLCYEVKHSTFTPNARLEQELELMYVQTHYIRVIYTPWFHLGVYDAPKNIYTIPQITL